MNVDLNVRHPWETINLSYWYAWSLCNHSGHHLNSKSILSATPLYIAIENNYVTEPDAVLVHDLFVTIMVITKRTHACIPIDSLLGVMYIEIDIHIHTACLDVHLIVTIKHLTRLCVFWMSFYPIEDTLSAWFLFFTVMTTILCLIMMNYCIIWNFIATIMNILEECARECWSECTSSLKKKKNKKKR